MKKYICVTNHPVAYESFDHIEPKGTKADNSKSDSFLNSVINFKKEVRYLDLGCAGGGFVQQFVQAGQIAMGVEGSDYSKKNKRAEWATIPDNLFTADITKPFYFKDLETDDKLKFNVMSAFDVLEHLFEDQLPGFFNNLRSNLDEDGHFVCAIANFGDNGYHHTLKPEEWWLEKFFENGFIRDEFLTTSQYGRTSSHNLTFKFK
jgi:cyclopropane fatty-acyl-phospholipid synthase-like methyltransferase